jgi:serine/threonine protein kinase
MYDLTGKTIAGGQFRLSRRIGAGGFAEVYLARQLNLNRTVAVKILWDVGIDEETLHRFSAEAQAIAALEQTNIVRILVHGREEGFHYSVMNLLYGTLKDLLEDPPAFPIPETLIVARDVLAALAAAHGQSIAHRDIKPENIMFDSSGNSVVTDFGLVRRLDHTMGLTQAGAFMGTPLYMSPEQVDPERREDTRSDLYSFGIVLYEMLTGRTPFHDLSFFQVCEAHRNVTPPPPSEVYEGSPPELDPIVMRCLEKDAGTRYGHAQEVLDDLSALPAEVKSRFGMERERILELKNRMALKWKKLEEEAPPLEAADTVTGQPSTGASAPPAVEGATVMAGEEAAPEAPPRIERGGRGRMQRFLLPAAGVILVAVVGLVGVRFLNSGGGTKDTTGTTPIERETGNTPADPRDDGSGGEGPSWVGERGSREEGSSTNEAEPVETPSPTQTRTTETQPPVQTDARPGEIRIAAFSLDEEPLHLAQLYVDGRHIGEGAIQTLTLDAGTHQVRLTCIGYEEKEITIEIRPGENPVRKIHLQPE